MASALSRFRKDHYGGGLVVLLGLFAAYQGLDYEVGTLDHMGSGFFPVALGIILAGIGVTIMLAARTHLSPAEWAAEWRGKLCICGGIAAFILLGRYGGLLPATFAIVFISALGDRDNTVMSALGLSLVLVVVCVGVFWWGLQMQFPLFRWG